MLEFIDISDEFTILQNMEFLFHCKYSYTFAYFRKVLLEYKNTTDLMVQIHFSLFKSQK